MRTTFSSTYCPTVPPVQADGGANLYVSGLAEEVTEETLSRDDYETVSSSLTRMAVRATALLSGDFERWWHLGRYHRLATELAFSKHRLDRFPGEEETRARVIRLRRQVKDRFDCSCQSLPPPSTGICRL